MPDEWLGSHSRFVETGDLCRKLAHHRIPIDLLLYSDAEVQEQGQSIQHGVNLDLLDQLFIDCGGDPTRVLSLENFTPFGSRLRCDEEAEPENLDRVLWNQTSDQG